MHSTQGLPSSSLPLLLQELTPNVQCMGREHHTAEAAPRSQDLHPRHEGGRPGDQGGQVGRHLLLGPHHGGWHDGHDVQGVEVRGEEPVYSPTRHGGHPHGPLGPQVKLDPTYFCGILGNSRSIYR